MGFQTKSTTKKICKYSITKGEKEIQKRVKQILANLKSDWNILVQDESIFVYDYIVYDYIVRRKKWISPDKRPLVTVTDSRKRTIVLYLALYL